MARKTIQTVVNLSDIAHSRDRIGQNMDLAVQAFISSRIAANCAKASISYYDQALRTFSAFMEGLKVVPNQLQPEHLAAYVAYLKVRGNAVTTININLRAVRAFVRYLHEGGYIPRQIKVPLLKEDKRLIRVFSDEEVRRLIAEPDLTDVSFAGYRDWAIACFLLAVGVRRHTLLDMRIGDIDFVAKRVRLATTKTRTEQVIPLPPSLERVLAAYLKVRGGGIDDYLFCNQYGQRLAERSIEDRMKEYCTVRGITADGRKLGCHIFRHTFASMAARNGADIVVLQQILGHSSLVTTQRYIHLLIGDLQRMFVSPLDTLVSTSRNKGRKAIKMTRERN